MNTPTPDPLPLSEERLMKYGFTPEQYIPGARGFELLVHQARLAIKLKEENEALRKAGEEMGKALEHLINSYENAQSCPSDNECHEDCWEEFNRSRKDLTTLSQWRKVREEGV